MSIISQNEYTELLVNLIQSGENSALANNQPGAPLVYHEDINGNHRLVIGHGFDITEMVI